MTRATQNTETQVTAANAQDLEQLIQEVKAAQSQYAHFSQAQVDAIFKQAAIAANNARIPLAKQAVAETGMGIVEDKVIKNHFASEYIYNKYKNEKTCGQIYSDTHYGIQKYAEPIGIIAGIVPTTNPTSTTVFKALLALKTRNAIIFSPHPRACHCSIEAARIVRDAAEKAGAPKGLIGWLDHPTIQQSQALMQHPDIQLILATGGPGMVKAAYASGHPSLGVGAGNTPAVIDETADIPMAVSSILLSKTFDNGMICASEQSAIIVDSVYETTMAEFQKRGAYVLSPEEKDRLSHIILKDNRLNSAIVGQSVQQLAQLAELEIPGDIKVLLGEVSSIGFVEPLSCEKLSPILAIYRVPDYQTAVQYARELVDFAGRGHTSVLYTNPDNHGRIEQFENEVATARVLINTPSSQGAIGDLYNFKLDPSLTLGCGTWGGNSISENVGVHHLLNLKTVTERRENMLWFRVPPKVYFKPGCIPIALGDIADKQRALIVTDRPLYDLGLTKEITTTLDTLGLEHHVFFDVEPDPSFATIKRGLEVINHFHPDVIIAFGGGSPMDAAKVMWLMYEHPEVEFEGLAMRFMDIRKRVYELPPLGNKAILVAIPTTSGTGSEVTPFAVVTDEQTDIKYPLADYALTPSMAIVDPELVRKLPKSLTAYGGIDALTHALEAYVSVLASEFTDGLALEAISLLMTYLPRAYENGEQDIEAREKVHYAASIAGMAFANAFLGICHSLAHQLGATYHMPHGLANALMISHVIRYNATDAPFKQTIFPQYEYPQAKARYAAIATSLKLSGKTDDEKLASLIEAIESLKAQIGIPASLNEVLKESEETFLTKAEAMAEQAFDDQCTGANPRYPLIEELKGLLVEAYHGFSSVPIGKQIA